MGEKGAACSFHSLAATNRASLRSARMHTAATFDLARAVARFIARL